MGGGRARARRWHSFGFFPFVVTKAAVHGGGVVAKLGELVVVVDRSPSMVTRHQRHVFLYGGTAVCAAAVHASVLQVCARAIASASLHVCAWG